MQSFRIGQRLGGGFERGRLENHKYLVGGRRQ